MANWRVYRIGKTPLEGAKDYIDVSSRKEAEYLVKMLNKNAIKKDWVYG